MSLPRLRLESCTFDGTFWHISAEEAHHLIRVRRCYTGSLAEGLLRGEVVQLKLECSGSDVFAREISRDREEEIIPKTELLLAVLKNDQMDEALRFCAETAVSVIHLLDCERSVPHYAGERLAAKIERWEKILAEATKQAGAATPPIIRKPVLLRDFNFDVLPEQRLAALLSPEAKPLRSVNISEHLAMAIGPEGDWAPTESAALLQNGFLPVSLGKRIMRASTAVAAFSAMTAAMYDPEK